jgi:MFS family permease
MMICDVLGIITAIGSLFMNYTSLCLTRFFFGVLVGINSSIDPQYIQQYTPLSLSGMMGSFCNVGLLFGLTIAFILSWVFLGTNPDEYNS